MDCSLPGSSIHGIFQARVLEWGAIAFSLQATKASLINSKLSKKKFSLAQLNPKVSRRKEIIKIRAEITEKEIKEIIAKINKTKIWLFEKINKIDRLSARIIKKKWEKIQINKVRNESGEITTHNTEIQRITRGYYQQLYANKMDNLEEMDKFLEKYNLPKLNQEEIENLKQTHYKHGNLNCNQKSFNKQKPRTR